MLVTVLAFGVLLVAVFYAHALTCVDIFFPMGFFSLETYARFFATPSARKALAGSLEVH